MIYLKQSTASQEVILGPFLDDTDGKTAETGLTIANTDVKIYKAGATTSANKNSGGATHDASGRYSIVLDATDTNTLGSGEIHVLVTGALPVKKEFCVLPANIYDSFIGGTDLFDVSVTQFNGSAVTSASGRPEVNVSHVGGSAVSATSGLINANVTQISGSATAADTLEVNFDGSVGAKPLFGIVDQGTAQSATGTTLVLRAAAAFADDALNGATLIITGGSAGVGQSRTITDFVGTTDTATVETWGVTPTGTITYVIYGTAPDVAGGSDPTAAEIADAVWDELLADHVTSATFGKALGDVIVDTETTIPGLITTVDTVVDSILVDTVDIQSRLPAALVSGRIDASVGAMAAGVVTAAAIATNAIDADALAADAVTEIQSGLATAAALATVDTVVDAILVDTDTTIPGLVTTVDTVVDAIKVKTDSLTFGTAGVVDAHVKYVAGEQIDGAGTEGDPWGPV
jgi:hypothetical protein